MSGSGIEREAEGWERKLYDAMIAQDVAALEPLLADDLTYIHSPGFAETRDAYFTELKRGLYDYAEISTVSARTFAGGDYVTRNGLVEMLVGQRGQSRDRLKLLYTLVWRVTGEGWKLVVRQATRVP